MKRTFSLLSLIALTGCASYSPFRTNDPAWKEKLDREWEQHKEDVLNGRYYHNSGGLYRGL